MEEGGGDNAEDVLELVLAERDREEEEEEELEDEELAVVEELEEAARGEAAPAPSSNVTCRGAGATAGKVGEGTKIATPPMAWRGQPEKKAR